MPVWRKGRERSLHHPRAAQRTGSLKSGVPTRGRGCRGAGRLRAPGPNPQRRREQTPPAGPDRVTFPTWGLATETRSRAEGTEGPRSGWGES